MRHFLPAFFLAVMLAGTASAAPETGKLAPEFTAADAISGKPISLADFKGKIVVLEWNNFDCPFVKKFYDSNVMQELQKNARRGDVVWITVNSSAPGKQGHLADSAAVKAALAERKADPAAYLIDADGTIGKAYGASTTPQMFVIAKDGTLAYQGAIDSIADADAASIDKATNYVTAAIDALKSGKPVNPGTTQPYGCSVKYAN
jgi:peroxiredoxin